MKKLPIKKDIERIKLRKLFKIDPRLMIPNKIEELIPVPEIIRVNEFEEKNVKEFEESLDKAHMTGQPVIPIIIDSYGGQAHGVMGMIAAIESCRVPVATCLLTKAFSAGALLFCHGTEGYRFMHPDAQLMIHDVAAGTGGKIEEMKSHTNYVNELNNILYRKTSKHLGKQENYLQEQIKKHNHVDWFLNAKEAKKHGIANHLRIPCFNIEVSLKVELV